MLLCQTVLVLAGVYICKSKFCPVGWEYIASFLFVFVFFPHCGDQDNVLKIYWITLTGNILSARKVQFWTFKCCFFLSSTLIPIEQNCCVVEAISASSIAEVQSLLSHTCVLFVYLFLVEPGTRIHCSETGSDGSGSWTSFFFFFSRTVAVLWNWNLLLCSSEQKG